MSMWSTTIARARPLRRGTRTAGYVGQVVRSPRDRTYPAALSRSFSDIEDSTRLWEAAPDVMNGALLAHDEIVRTQVRSAGGKVIKHTGDGFSAVFGEAVAAVEAAAGISRSLAAHEWGSCPIRVRMGIHTGVTYPRDGDYFGPTINQAARVMDAGNGGQVLLSDAAAALVRSSLPAGVTLADLGSHRLKGLGEPLHLWHLLVSGGAIDDRAVRALDSLPNNLHDRGSARSSDQRGDRRAVSGGSAYPPGDPDRHRWSG